MSRSATRLASATLLASVVLASVLVVPPVGAESRSRNQAADDITVTAEFNGRPVAGAGNNDPIQLDPLRRSNFQLTIVNRSDEPLNITRIRLFGRAFGINFVAFDALFDATVAPGDTQPISVPVEFIDLERQATGLLPGGFAVFGENRRVIYEQDFVLDVGGSATSVIALFAYLTAIVTAFGTGALVLALRRRSLDPNRFWRLTRFGFLGFGYGLTIVAALSLFRVAAPTATLWVPVLLIPGAIAGAIGFFSPGWLDPAEPDESESEEDSGLPDPSPALALAEIGQSPDLPPRYSTTS